MHNHWNRSVQVSRLVPRLVLAVACLTGCGGGAASGEDPKAPTAKASLDLSPIDELRAIPDELNAELSSITQPIDDVQSIIDDITNLPKKYGITAADALGMAKTTLDSGKVEVNLSADSITAEARAEIESILNRLNGVVVSLKATPDKVTSLSTKTMAATAKVPVLASKISASASLAASNPFASAESKAQAKADILAVAKAQADVRKSVQDVQAKVMGVPSMATNALAKLTAAFASI